MSIFDMSDDVMGYVVSQFMTFDEKIIMMRVCTRIRKIFLEYSFDNEDELMIVKLIVGDYDNSEFEKIVSHFKETIIGFGPDKFYKKNGSEQIDITNIKINDKILQFYQLFGSDKIYMLDSEIKKEIIKLMIIYYNKCGKLLIKLINTKKVIIYDLILKYIKSVTKNDDITYYNILADMIKNADYWVSKRIIKEECINVIKNCRRYQGDTNEFKKMFKILSQAYISRNTIYNRNENFEYCKYNDDFDILVKLKYCEPMCDKNISKGVEFYIKSYIDCQNNITQNRLYSRYFELIENYHDDLLDTIYEDDICETYFQ